LLTLSHSWTYADGLEQAILSTFHEQLQRLSEQVRKRQPHIRGEESTKQSLVVPFLSALGYDVHDPTEFVPEHVADFAKRRAGGPAEKVDYAIHRDGVPVLFIECKSVDSDPSQHNGQLARYFNATPSVPIAVVTNGVRYVFFTDLEERNILSERPFFQFDIFNFSQNDADVLETFSRARYDAQTIRDQVEEIIYTNKIIAYTGDLLRNPSENFTRFVLSELELFSGKRLTPKLVEKFIPTVRRAVQASLLDMATRSIREHVADVDTPNAGLTVIEPAPVPVPRAASAPIITTPEELEAFEIIKGICNDSSMSARAPVVSRDTANWFTISAISPRKWFARLYFNQKKKSIVTKVSQSQAALLAPGFEVEVFQEYSRVYIGSPKDIHRLRPLILLAYEDEIKRQDTPEGEGEPAV
jgi:hypothetical protein